MLTFQEYGALFARLNKWQDHNFKNWIFKAGMNHGDHEFWWSSPGQKRPRHHEGIDFFCYEDVKGRQRFLDLAKVPCPCQGEVIALCSDFLGQSVFVINADAPGTIDIFVAAHIKPVVKIGDKLQCGAAIGTIAPGKGKVPGHLHVSGILGDWHELPEQLSWPALNKQNKLQFVCPFQEEF